MSFTLVIAGIGVMSICLLVNVFGWSTPTTIASPQQAVQSFQYEYPDAQVTAVTIADDHNTALLALQQSPAVGLVHVVGGQLVNRYLHPGSLASVEFQSAGHLQLRFHDFTYPQQAFPLHDRTAAQRWHTHLAALTMPAPH